MVVEEIDSDSILSSDEVVTETDSDSVVVSPMVVVSLSEVSEVSEQGFGYNTLSLSSKQQCSLFGWSSFLLKHWGYSFISLFSSSPSSMSVAVLDESVVVCEISSVESSVADAFISSDEPPHGHGYNTWYWLLKQQRFLFGWLLYLKKHRGYLLIS